MQLKVKSCPVCQSQSKKKLKNLSNSMGELIEVKCSCGYHWKNPNIGVEDE